MTLVNPLGLPSTSLEPSTLLDPSYFSHWDNFDTLDQKEPMEVDPPGLSQSHIVQPWPQLPSPESPPTQRDWDNYRNIFTQLYQIEERPLKEVKGLLEQCYDFKATERMYKKRITAWNAMKNYKRKDKEAVCRALQRRNLAGKAHHQVMIKGQPAKVHRILRHMQNSARQGDSRGLDCPPMPTEEDEIEVFTPDNGIISNEQSSPQNSWRDLLRQLMEVLCLESVRYFETMLSSDACTRPRAGSAMHSNPFTVMGDVEMASALAKSERYTETRLILNGIFDKLKDLIHDPSPELLTALLENSLSSQRDRAPFKVRNLLLEHVVALCKIRLGMRHPVTVVMSISRGIVDHAEAWNTITGSLLDTTIEHTQHIHGPDLLMNIMSKKAGVLQELGRLQEAERTLQRALTICRSMQGTGHGWGLQILQSVAWLNFRGLQNYSEARTTFQNILRSVGREDMPWAIWGKLRALSGLAAIAEAESDLPTAESLHRQALDVSLKAWGAEEYCTIFTALILERTLRDRGNDKEADHIRESFCIKDDCFI